MTDFLCIGIPARNEQESIERTIRSITSSLVWKQTPCKDKELIICVNNSTDRTREIVEGLQRIFPEIKIIVSNIAGKNRAVNTIARAANERAKEIYFSDADVLVKRDTIGKVLKALRGEKKIEFAAAVPVPTASFFLPSKRGLTAALYVEWDRFLRRNKKFNLFGAGYAVRKRFLLENPSPENLKGEQLFLNLSYHNKIRIIYDAMVVVRQPSLIGHFRQRVRARRLREELFEARPDLKASFNRGLINPRKQGLLKNLSPKAKAGLALNQLVEIAAKIAAKRKTKEPWTQLASTKLHRKGK